LISLNEVAIRPARLLLGKKNNHQGSLSLHPSGIGKSSTGLRGWGYGGTRLPVSMAGVISYDR